MHLIRRRCYIVRRYSASASALAQTSNSLYKQTPKSCLSLITLLSRSHLVTVVSGAVSSFAGAWMRADSRSGEGKNLSSGRVNRISIDTQAHTEIKRGKADKLRQYIARSLPRSMKLRRRCQCLLTYHLAISSPSYLPFWILLSRQVVVPAILASTSGIRLSALLLP